MLVIHGNDPASDVGSRLVSQIKEMRRFLRSTAHLFRQRIRRRDGLSQGRRRGCWPSPAFLVRGGPAIRRDRICSSSQNARTRHVPRQKTMSSNRKDGRDVYDGDDKARPCQRFPRWPAPGAAAHDRKRRLLSSDSAAPNPFFNALGAATARRERRRRRRGGILRRSMRPDRPVAPAG
jgi:hypothetical protein